MASTALCGLAAFGCIYLVYDIVKGFVRKISDEEIVQYHKAVNAKDPDFATLEKAFGCSTAQQIVWAYRSDQIGKEEFDNEVFRAKLLVANGIVYERKNK